MAFFDYDFKAALLFDKITKEDVISVIENNNSNFEDLSEVISIIGYSQESRRILVITALIENYTFYPLSANLPHYESTIKKYYCKN